MATRMAGNWACAAIRRLIDDGLSAQEIARYLASQDKFIAAVQAGIDGHHPARPGGDGAEQVVRHLCDVLAEEVPA